MESTGFDKVPERYSTESGREAIDLIRDSMSDQEFGVYCRGQALKYRLRLGKKDSPDEEKARWYDEMALHVLADGEDPRTYREGFDGYKRAAMPEPIELRRIDVLDHGFVRLIETWGGGETRLPEAGIIEAARQSTQGSFRGWSTDRKLLAFLHNNKHSTPFEFAGMVLEIRAPIFAFREWHRHRTQSYNEMSARYAPLPDLNYLPSVDRIVQGSQATANKQAGSVKGAPVAGRVEAAAFRMGLEGTYTGFQNQYQAALDYGIPKELARCGMPVGRYSQMRAQANLRNWIGFLTLRLDPAAQWEIRQYAQAVLDILMDEFPETGRLFIEPRS